MIQRLLITLRALSNLSPGDLGTSNTTRLAEDCADALRLELDCPQQELTPAQRRILVRLSELLETPAHSETLIRDAARAAYAVIQPYEEPA